MAETVQAGDAVALVGPEGERHFATAGPGTQRVGGLGVVDTAALVGKPWGAPLPLGLKRYTIVRPLLPDHLRGLERKAQIVIPKDAARIVFETGLRSGDRVVEAGVGSGSLTLALAHRVSPGGRVIALDQREDHLAVGRRNVERAGLAEAVDFRLADIRKGVPERDLDAAVLDIPDPEIAIPALAASLRPGAAIAVYTPHITQAEKAVTALRETGFWDLRTLELLERTWTFQAQGARPDFEMLGHTGFLTFARRGGSIQSGGNK